MGWVDLWRGILFCDVLHETPCLRGVPVNELSYNNGTGMKLGSPLPRRGIAFARDKGCLNLVHLEMIVDRRLPGLDEQVGAYAIY